MIGGTSRKTGSIYWVGHALSSHKHTCTHTHFLYQTNYEWAVNIMVKWRKKVPVTQSVCLGHPMNCSLYSTLSFSGVHLPRYSILTSSLLHLEHQEYINSFIQQTGPCHQLLQLSLITFKNLLEPLFRVPILFCLYSLSLHEIKNHFPNSQFLSDLFQWSNVLWTSSELLQLAKLIYSFGCIDIPQWVNMQLITHLMVGIWVVSGTSAAQ